MKNIFKTIFIATVFAAVTTVGADSSKAANLIRVPGLEISAGQGNEFSEVTALYAEPNYSPDANCDLHTQLTLDAGAVSGKFAVVEEKVAGSCEIAVVANPRFYKLTTRSIGCGSLVHAGEMATNDGLNRIEIIDHRGRLCRDAVPARIIVKETQAGATTVLYSANRQLTISASLNAPTDGGGFTCMAYWEGYEIEGGACKKKSASGCSNPFPFTSLAACEDSSAEKPLFQD